MSQEDRGPIGPRIGTFFILVGVGFIILFIASDLAENAPVNFDYFFLGVFFMVVAFLFRRKAPKPPSSNRFSGIRRMRERSKKRKEEKLKKK